VLIIPPLIITEEQLKEGMGVLDKALEITDKAVR
jgi:4-aminobutyrate aminotransferase-like enzyme